MSEPQDKVDISDLKDTFLECPVCVEHFNQTDRRPRLLHSCLHAFCTQCLHQLLIKEGKGHITCPLCRRVQKVSGKADTLPVDPVRSKLVEYTDIKHKKKVLCTDCPDQNDAEGRCEECRVYLCKDCIFAHKRHRLSRDHVIETLEKVLNQTLKEFTRGHFCLNHPKHHVEFYCSTDEELCCISCTVVDHKGHEFEKLEKAAAKRKLEIEHGFKDANKTQIQLRQSEEKAKEQQKAIQQMQKQSVSDINEMFDAMKQKLDQRRNQLLFEVQNRSGTMLSSVQKASAAHDQTLAMIESTDTYFTQAKEKADVVEMLQMYPAIKRSMSLFLDSPAVQDVKTDTNKIRYTPSGRRAFDDIVKSLGALNVKVDPSFKVEYDKKGCITASGKLLTVKVYEADITSLRTDIIVNASNKSLSHGGGVARHIASKAGPLLIEGGDRIIRRRGDLLVTEAVMTNSGLLPCKMVMHALGPEWIDYADKSKCLDDLCYTIIRCLCGARNNGMTSIAFPSINSSLFAVPNDLCAKMYVRALKSFDQAVDGGSLREVHFVDVSDNMDTIVQKEFERTWNQPEGEEDLRKDTAFISLNLGSSGALVLAGWGQVT